MPVQYRTATPDDITIIVDFQLAMARETEGMLLDRDVVTRGVGRVLDRPELGTYYVAERGGQLVGCLLVTNEWSDWRDGQVLWIQSVYVAPEARGKGIYRGLYEHVLALAQRDPQVRGIRLYVDARNTTAQAVYSRLGMNGEHYRVFEWMKNEA